MYHPSHHHVSSAGIKHTCLRTRRKVGRSMLLFSSLSPVFAASQHHQGKTTPLTSPHLPLFFALLIPAIGIYIQAHG